METDPKSLTRRWLDECWNRRRPEVAEELMGPDTILYQVAPGAETIRDAAGFRKAAEPFLSAFSDLRVEIEDVIAEGDKAVARCVVTATHSGPGLGIPATGRTVRMTGMAFGEWRDGKLVRGWNNFDFRSLFEQLEA